MLVSVGVQVAARFGARCPRRSNPLCTFFVAGLWPPKGSASSLKSPARIARVPVSKTVSDKVLELQGGGLHVLSASVNCAGWSSIPSSHPCAAPRKTRALRRYT